MGPSGIIWTISALLAIQWSLSHMMTLFAKKVKMWPPLRGDLLLEGERNAFIVDSSKYFGIIWEGWPLLRVPTKRRTSIYSCHARFSLVLSVCSYVNLLCKVPSQLDHWWDVFRADCVVGQPHEQEDTSPENTAVSGSTYSTLYNRGCKSGRLNL